jgi:hypothetical protein
MDRVCSFGVACKAEFVQWGSCRVEVLQAPSVKLVVFGGSQCPDLLSQIALCTFAFVVPHDQGQLCKQNALLVVLLWSLLKDRAFSYAQNMSPLDLAEHEKLVLNFRLS